MDYKFDLYGADLTKKSNFKTDVFVTLSVFDHHVNNVYFNLNLNPYFNNQNNLVFSLICSSPGVMTEVFFSACNFNRS